MKRNNILSIDQARITGYCIYKKSMIKASGVWKFSTDHLKRLLEFYNKLITVIKRERITQIVAEDIYDGINKAVVSLGEMRGVLLLISEKTGIPICFISPKEHKYSLTGNQYANKSETMNRLTRMGYKFKDDNEADAISIMLHYLKSNHLPILMSDTSIVKSSHVKP